jgi:predicted nucleotidyltransferase
MGAVDSGPAVLADLGESLCRDDDVEFALLFGSRVTGTECTVSDLDVAVKFSEQLPPGERFRKRCFLAGDLQRENAPFLDVSDMEGLPLDVAHDAVNGTLLCGDTEAFREYKSAVESAFEARGDEIRRHQRGVIDRIAEDGLHG